MIVPLCVLGRLAYYKMLYVASISYYTPKLHKYTHNINDIRTLMQNYPYPHTLERPNTSRFSRSYPLQQEAAGRHSRIWRKRVGGFTMTIVSDDIVGGINGHIDRIEDCFCCFNRFKDGTKDIKY